MMSTKLRHLTKGLSTSRSIIVSSSRLFSVEEKKSQKFADYTSHSLGSESAYEDENMYRRESKN